MAEGAGLKVSIRHRVAHPPSRRRHSDVLSSGPEGLWVLCIGAYLAERTTPQAWSSTGE